MIFLKDIFKINFNSQNISDSFPHLSFHVLILLDIVQLLLEKNNELVINKLQILLFLTHSSYIHNNSLRSDQLNCSLTINTN